MKYELFESLDKKFKQFFFLDFSNLIVGNSARRDYDYAPISYKSSN